MKNKIRFAITALALVLFAACFFVSCSDDVIVNKDNDHSYAEVLESNGAFVYNGQNYETLQGAIDAAAKAESQARAIDVQKEAITVTGNVKTREVVIPENADILMNLKGFEVSFFDVQTNAITVGKNSSFAAFNGTLAMADKQEGLVVISVGGENSNIELDSLKINAAGQTALLLDAGSTTALSKSVSVEGTVIARGGKKNTTLAMENSLSDVKLGGASLIVEGSGSAVITKNSGENEFVVSPTATVIDQTGTIDPKVIEDSICYIVRKGELLTFGSLREAVASLEYDNETIVFITTETSTATESFTLSRPATVELNGFSASVNNIVLADGANLTITGKAKNAKGTAYPSFAGTITSAEGAVASLVLNSVEMMGSVDISGSLTATETVFNSHLVANSGVSLENSGVKADLAIGSENGDVKLTNVTGKAGVISAPGEGKDVTIDNSKAKAALETGAIVADDIVAVKGKEDLYVTVTEGVVGTFLNAEYATFKDAAVILDKLTSENTVFEKEILAGEIEDEGSTFKDDITADKGNLALTGSNLDNVKVITSAAGGNITIVKSTGSIGKIETKAPEADSETAACGSVIVDNSKSENAIEIGEITAVGDITLTGDDKNAVLTVTGSVSGKDIKAEYCTFDAKEESASITASTVNVKSSVFSDDEPKKISKPFYSIETTGKDSEKDSEKAYSLAIYSSTGRLGALNAKDGSVFVEEGQSVLVTGSITAKDEIHTTVTKDIYLIVSGDVAGSSLYADYTRVNGNVELSKNLNSGYSYFAGTVTAGTTVTDIDGTIFEKDITANGDITLTGSKFVTENEAKPAITSTAGNILMTKVTGTTGALTASGTGNDVTINNKDSGLITTGSITADDAVSLTGRTGNVVTAGAVQAVSLNASYAAVTGVVSLSGDLTSANSVFESAISAATVVDAGSTFKSAILTKANGGGAKFTGSVFASTDEQPVAVLSLSGNIEMTGVTGKSGNLMSAQGSVTIDNSEAKETLITGAIKAKDAVSIKGKSSVINVVVEAIEEEEKWSVKAATMDVAYATVKGKVELSGKLSSGNSVFEAEVSAASVKDNGSCFYSNITATTGDVVLTGSTFGSASAPYPAVTSKLGNIVMTGVSGNAGALTASSEGKAVTINNKVSGLITTGSIIAGDAVSLTGRTGNVVTAGAVQAVSLNASYAAVTGVVSLRGDLTSANSVFESAVSAKGSILDKESTFAKDVTAEGNVILTKTAFEGSPAVKSTTGDIEMTNATGKAGMLKASNVTVSNYAAVADLETGAIVAVNAVAVAGHADGTFKVTVEGVAGATLDVSRSTVAGAVTLTGGMTSKLSVFSYDVSASTVSDNGSTFNDVVFTNVDGGDAVFDSSKFASENANVISSSGNIIMTGVTGTAGNLMSSLGCVTIDNSEATASLSTGSVEAAEAVSIKGKSSDINVVARSNVKASTLDTVYATVYGTVTLSGDMTSANSVFKGDVSLDGNLKSSGSSFAAVSANAVIDSISLFAGNITAVDDVSLTGSVFESNAGIESTAGNILLTEVTGNAGNLSAPADGKNVTIDNAKALAALETGRITAGNAVAVTGSLIYQNSQNSTKVNSVTVVGVYGKTLDSSYANLDGAVELSGNLKSGYSVFAGTCAVSAFTVVDSNSTVEGDITAEEDATFENTVFHPTADIRSTNGNIQMTKTTGESGIITASTYGKNVTIDNALATDKFTTGRLTAGDAVSVTGNSDHVLTVAGVSASTLVADFATFSDSINAKYEVSLTNSVFAEGADVISSFGSIAMTKVTGTAGNLEAISVNINNAEATKVLSTKLIKTADAVTVNGNSRYYVTVAGVKSSSLDAVYASFSDDILTSGEVAISESEFTSVNADIKSSSDNIILTKVTGTAGSLTAYSVTINNADVQLQSTVETSLTTGAIEAVDAVTVTGNSKHAVKVGGVSGLALDVTYATVTGAVQLTGDLTASYSRFSKTVALSGDLESVNTAFEGNVTAATITAERGYFFGISNDNNIEYTTITATSGDVKLAGSILEGANVISRNGKIEMTNVTSGIVLPAGMLKASTVTIDNAQATGALNTGAIEAVGGAVTVTGSSSHPVTVAGVIGNTLDAVYTTVTGAVELSGDLTAADSIFLGAVSAAAITAERGEFKGVVTATTGDVVLTGSKFSSEEADVKSTLGNIEMTKVTGTAGALEATNVTISNADATGKLSTGAIKAVGAVDLTGNSTYRVTAAGVFGSTLETTYATVTGDVDLSGALTSTDSAFNGDVSATVITDERGTFGNGVVDAATITATKGDVTLTGSVFKGSGVTSSEGSILMTKVTGTAGALEAYGVTITNDQTSTALVTGAINCVGAVKVTGNSKYYVTVGGVTGTKLDADYAVISGNIEVATGDVTLTDSKFSSEEADVKSTLGNITMTKVTGTAGDLSAYVAVTIDNTKVLGTTEPLSTGSIEANDAITLKGNYGHVVTVASVTGKATLVADYVSVSGQTIVYGGLTSSNSTFTGTVSAAAIDDTRSEFSGAVYGTGDVKLTGSRFNSNTVNVNSWTGDIDMTGVSGTAGSLRTYGSGKTITIDNSKSFATLTTGAINTDGGAVTVTGNAYLGAGNLNVGAVSGTALDVDYARVTGEVTLSGALDSDDSVFSYSVSAATVTADRSKFWHDITATGNVEMIDSYFYQGADVASTAGSISMTNVTGLVYNLTASAAGMDITIDNSGAEGELTTWGITAADAVTVTGNSNSLVTVNGNIAGATLDADYANLNGSIDMTTSVAADNCTVGDSLDTTSGDDVESASIAITDSKIKLRSITSTGSVTITNPVLYGTDISSAVITISTANLTVTDENAAFSAKDVAASGSIAINGGTYTGVFAFSGSTASTISAGRFTGTFSHTGTAALSITGGLFTGMGSVQSLESGTTTIDGTYASTDVWNVVFDNLSITGDAAVIKSGYFKAKDAGQLNNIGAKISQTESSVSDSKFVDIVYAGSEIKGASSLYYTNVKKANISFNAPAVTGNMSFTYPTSVVLSGSIVLKNSNYTVVSNNRALNDASGYSIVRKNTGSPAYCEQVGSVYTYYYAQP